MATRVWRGDAEAVAQVDRFTPANVEVNDVFSLTMGLKSVSYTSTAATVAAVATGLAKVWNASSEPEMATLTASTGGSTAFTLTADTAGVAFTVTASAVNNSTGGVDNQSLTRAAVTANQGPNAFDSSVNWSGGVVPTTGDAIVFENSNVDCLYGLSQTFKPASIDVRQSYTGKLGLPRNNDEGYTEYLTRYLTVVGSTQAGGTAITIGEGEGSGSGRIMIDCSSGQFTANIHGKGTRAETGIPCVLLQGDHASNALNVNRGDVGVAFFAGETAALGTLDVGYQSNQSSDAAMVGGSGLAVTTFTQRGGFAELRGNVTTITQTAGELVVGAAAAVTTLNARGGQVRYRSSGTVTTLNVNGGAEVDYRQDNRSRTVTNCNLYQGARLQDPGATVTFTNGLDLHQCGLPDVSLDLGEHRSYALSAI